MRPSTRSRPTAQSFAEKLPIELQDEMPLVRTKKRKLIGCYNQSFLTTSCKKNKLFQCHAMQKSHMSIMQKPCNNHAKTMQNLARTECKRTLTVPRVLAIRATCAIRVLQGTGFLAICATLWPGGFYARWRGGAFILLASGGLCHGGRAGACGF